MGMAELLTNPALWGALGQFGQSLAARDPTSFGYQMGGYAKNLAQAEAYRKQLEKQKKAEEEKKKAEGLGSLGKIAGSVGGFLLGGPAGAAAGSALGGYAGERLGGSDPNETPLLPTVMKAGLGYGTAKASDYLGGKLAETSSSPQVAPTIDPAVEQTNLAAPTPTEVPLDAPVVAAAQPTLPAPTAQQPSTAAALSNADPTQLTNKDWNKLFQHPDYHTRLAAALAYSLNTPNPSMAGTLSDGGGSSSVPPLQTGSFGMEPELVNQLNELSLARWKAGRQDTTTQTELGLKGRQVAADEARVANEGIRALADLHRASRERGINYNKSIETVDENGDPLTLLIDTAHPEIAPIKFKGIAKVQGTDILDTVIPDSEAGASSTTGWWKMRLNTKTGEKTMVPTAPPASTYRNPPPLPAPDITEEKASGGKVERVARDKQTGQELWRQSAGSDKKEPNVRREADGSSSTFNPDTLIWENNGAPDVKYVRKEFVKGLEIKSGEKKATRLKSDVAKALIESLAPGWSPLQKAKFADSVKDYIDTPVDQWKGKPGKMWGFNPSGERMLPSMAIKFEDDGSQGTAENTNPVPVSRETVATDGTPVVWSETTKDPKNGKLGTWVPK